MAPVSVARAEIRGHLADLGQAYREIRTACNDYAQHVDVFRTTRPTDVVGPAGEARQMYVSGTVTVITEDDIVVTVITR